MSASVLTQTPEAETITFEPKPYDDAMATLVSKRDSWVTHSVAQRIAMLKNLTARFWAVADRWVEQSVLHKGIELGSSGYGEEWLGGPYSVLRNLRLLRESLEGVERRGVPRLPGPLKQLPNGQVVAPVFPADNYDALFFMGTTGEIWLQPEVSIENFPQQLAVAYQNPPKKGEICLVLGAGNVSSIGPMDAIYKLFVELKVVILKMHPVNAYLGPLIEEAFAELIAAGYMRVVYGGIAEGAYLCKHAEVGEIHITGSDKTHDAIVFGAEVEARKKARQPLLDKPITSELGNVSAVIVVPGPWSEGDFEFQAENLVTSLANNGGYNCNASRVIVTQRGWKGREPLLEAIGKRFAALPNRLAYYPGAQSRFDSYLEAHPHATLFGKRSTKHLPWTLISDVDPEKGDDICFQTESFCSVFCETNLEAADPAAFIKKAVDFANDTLWGTLNVTLLVHPATLKDKATADAFDQALMDLKFGMVAVNHWAAIGYAMCTTSWGAYPGHDIYDIRSGRGVVHNTYLMDKVQKSVVRGPFRPWPKPPWFTSHEKGGNVGRKLAAFEADPSFLKLPGIFLEALSG